MLSAFKFRSLPRFCKNTAIPVQTRSGSYTRPNNRQVDVEKSVASIIKTSFRNDLQERGVPTKKNFLLCVSGGSDSIAMMHIMQKICNQTQPSMPVGIIFFNHKKRTESDEEVRITMLSLQF